ncbi:MAG: acylphosphatase [bacterium]|nr:acylphosphatase [bacterium]
MDLDPRLHIYIAGHVQGVFFRDWAKRGAQELGLTGWIKNLPDRRIEAVFEGPKSKLEEILRRCNDGPSAAQVEHVEAIWGKATGEFKTFEIIYHY